MDIEVSVRGDGPAVLLPIDVAKAEGETAEQMRAWGADPDAGHTLATGLAGAGFRVVAADYVTHLQEHPRPDALDADAVAADLLAIADAAGVERFVYYGYSLLAVAGLQLAVRTDRLTGLALGGWPPLGAPYDEMLAVTRAAHRMAVNRHALGADASPPREVEPGDWESSEVTETPEQTRQFVTLYESLRGFDERAALDRLAIPRLAFAGARDTIQYGPKWGNVRVAIGDSLAGHRAELVERGWTVTVIPDTDHIGAMHAGRILPILLDWLPAAVRR